MVNLLDAGREEFDKHTLAKDQCEKWDDRSVEKDRKRGRSW